MNSKCLKRGAHAPSSSVVLDGVLAGKREFVALRAALEGLAAETQAKLWMVAQTGRGDLAAPDWDEGMAAALLLTDDDLVENLFAEPELRHCLRKGLSMLGVATLPDDQRAKRS
jgi:hypothetical protein